MLVLAACCLAGCGLTSSERIGLYQDGVAEYQKQSAERERDIIDIKSAIEDMRDTLAEPGIGEPEKNKIIKGIEEGLDAIAKAQAIKATVDAKAAALQLLIDQAQDNNATIGDELRLWGQSINEVSDAMPAPVSAWGKLIGAALLGIGGLWVRRSTRQASEAKNQLAKEQNVTTKIVGAVGEVLKSADDTDRAVIKDTLKAMGPEASLRVAEIKHTQK